MFDECMRHPSFGGNHLQRFDPEVCVGGSAEANGEDAVTAAGPEVGGEPTEVVEEPPLRVNRGRRLTLLRVSDEEPPGREVDS
jgi:hypothetical protein